MWRLGVPLAVLSALLAGAAAAGPSKGIYRGATSQHLRMSLTVRRSAVVAVQTKTRDGCTDKAQPIFVGSTKSKIDGRGHFAMTMRTPAARLTVVGHFKGSRVTGA